MPPGAFFVMSVTIEPFIIAGDQGRGTYGDAVKTKARVEDVAFSTSDASGEYVMTKARVYIPGTVEIGTHDRLTLPGGVQCEIISIATAYDGRGRASHKVVLI